MQASKIFIFEAAHKLPNYPGKCSNLHGHTWKLIVSCSGKMNKGMVIDFLEIKKIVEENVLNRLNHSYLNDFIENPTCENVILWIKKELENRLNLEKLTLYESEDCFCEIEA